MTLVALINDIILLIKLAFIQTKMIFIHSNII